MLMGGEADSQLLRRWNGFKNYLDRRFLSTEESQPESKVQRRVLTHFLLATEKRHNESFNVVDHVLFPKKKQ